MNDMDAFRLRDSKEIQRLLSSTPNLEPTAWLDENNNTILHLLTVNDNTDSINHYLTYVNRQATQKGPQWAGLSRWINYGNKEGFTALHYAAYYGHKQSIELLLKYHADPKLKNISGQNALHLAAQNDKIVPFIQLRDVIDLNDADSNGLTPLHWAAYLGSENVVKFLLAQPTLKLNCVNNKGQTPLILAASFGNTLIVRNLLLKGADRSLKDNSQRKAIDYARESAYERISDMLDDKLSPWQHIKIFYNIRKMYEPRQRNYTYPIIFALMSLMTVGYTAVLIQMVPLWLEVCRFVLYGLLFLLYGLLLKGPPNIQKAQNIPLLDDFRDFCFECQSKQPKRGYHCDICRMCICQFDHHCTWINNCVGKRNIGKFLFFLVVLVPTLFATGILTVFAGFNTWQESFSTEEQLFRFRFADQFADYQNWQRIGICFGFLVVAIICMFAVPLTALLFNQISNLVSNQTSYEKARKVSMMNQSNSSASQNSNIRDRLRKYKTSSLNNCKIMCSNNTASFSDEVDAHNLLDPLNQTPKSDFHSDRASLGKPTLIKPQS